MLVLSEQQVQSLIDIDELIDALAQAHVQYSTGKAVMPVRLVVPLPQIQGRITSMPGFLTEDKALGMKVVTYFQDNPKITCRQFSQLSCCSAPRLARSSRPWTAATSQRFAPLVLRRWQPKLWPTRKP